MSIFVPPTKATSPKTKNIIPISIFLAAFLTLLAILQLFSFEDFPSRLADIGISPSVAPLLAALIATLEVLALPFALRLSLSPAFRVLSMACGWIAGALLLFISLSENIYAPAKLDAVLGATLPLPVGSWSICAALTLIVLVGWTSWDLFPLRFKK